MKKKIMLDANAYDELENYIDQLENSDRFEFYTTYIQEDQLKAIPDVEKRKKLLELFERLSPQKASTMFVFPMKFADGYTFMFRSSEVYDKVKTNTQTPHNELTGKKIARLVSDPKIADAAVYYDCALVTSDKRLLEKMLKDNREAYSVDAFIAMINTKDVPDGL